LLVEQFADRGYRQGLPQPRHELGWVGAPGDVCALFFGDVQAAGGQDFKECLLFALGPALG
jgi:hypothetical protein